MTQPSPLAGRRVLVIGAETPAGAAIAAALGEAGAAIALAAMRADEGVLAARRVQRALQAQGHEATTYAFDVTLGQNVKVSTRQVTKELGGLDIVVSAADLYMAGPLRSVTESDLGRVTSVNFHAHAYAARAAADELRRAEGGHIVLVAHAAGEGGLAGAAAYAASHAATLSLVRSLSEEWRAEPFAVSAVVVGSAEGGTHVPLVPGEAEGLGSLVLSIVSAAPSEVAGRVFRVAPAPAESRA